MQPAALRFGLATRTTQTIAWVPALALACSLATGCRKNSTLDDIPPAPGDPYTNATTPPDAAPAGDGDAPATAPRQTAPEPLPGTRPEPQPEAKPRTDPRPKPNPQPDSSPASGAAASPPAATPAVALPEQRVPDEAGNTKKVETFERCRAKCDSRTDLSAEDKPTCKLDCVNGTAASDSYADNCKRGCLREANRCYNPCEASGSASCRSACANPLLACMNDCDVGDAGG